MALAPTKAERDARLKALKAAADTWFTLEKERLEKETQFLRQVLQARGANDAAALNLLEATQALEDEIAAYLFVRQQ